MVVCMLLAVTVASLSGRQKVSFFGEKWVVDRQGLGRYAGMSRIVFAKKDLDKVLSA